MHHERSTLARILGNAAISLVGFALFLTIAPMATAQTVYAINDSTLDLGTLNLSSGVFTPDGGSPGSVSSGLAAQDLNLYTRQYQGNTLYQVNPTNGAITPIGSGSIRGGYRCTGAAAGIVYGFSYASPLSLYLVNTATGATTLIGPLGISGSDLGCSSDGTVLYVTLGDVSGSGCSSSTLWSVNTSTGTATEIGCTGVSTINDLVYTSGNLWGNSTGGCLYTISTSTGLATQQNCDGDLFSGMAALAAFSAIHTFSGSDGANPSSGVTVQGENLYGTTSNGGSHGDGTVYKLKPSGSSYILSPLYEFGGGSDGAHPEAGVVFGPNGSLYGTTNGGAGGNCGGGCGTVYNLRPPATACKTAICYWTETQLHIFAFNGTDGFAPEGNLAFDQAGNIYGTTYWGGPTNGSCGNGCGTVYELAGSGNNWTETILHNFSGPPNDGYEPESNVIFDSAGNLDGTTYHGGNGNCNGGCGTIFQLAPSGSGWTENILANLPPSSDSDAVYLSAGLIMDPSGNLYTATSGIQAAVLELPPSGMLTVLGTLPASAFCGVVGNLVMDSAGNLYGTTYCGGNNNLGNVFKLTPTPEPPWTYTDLHDFTGGSDGSYPEGDLSMDANGNLYGTASKGGNLNDCEGAGCGVVREITNP